MTDLFSERDVRGVLSHCSCLDHPRSIFTNRALFSTQHQIFFSFNCDNKRYQSRAALIMLMFRLFLLHPCNIHTCPIFTQAQNPPGITLYLLPDTYYHQNFLLTIPRYQIRSAWKVLIKAYKIRALCSKTDALNET